MADKETPQKLDEPEMSIDELSAAIDAHMTDLSKKKKSKKKTTKPKEPEEKPSEVETETPKEEKIEVKTKPKKKEVEEQESNEETETKVTVKRSYVSKSADKNSTTVPSEEKGSIAQTAKVKLAPISKKSEQAKEAKEDKEEKTSQEDESPKTSMVDVMVNKKDEEEKTESPTKEPKPIQKPDKEKDETEETQTKKIEDEPKPREKISETKEETKSPEAKETPVIKNSNSIDDLTSQMPAKKEAPKLEEPETLKTFDTKQYHIPIKPSRHHKRGSSFMVFVAVFAALLAVIYVLNELEIIDIAELISSY